MLFFEGKKTLASWGCIVDVNPLAKIFPCGAIAEKEQTNIPEYPEYKPQTIPCFHQGACFLKFFSQKHCIFFNFFRKFRKKTIGIQFQYPKNISPAGHLLKRLLWTLGLF